MGYSDKYTYIESTDGEDKHIQTHGFVIRSLQDAALELNNQHNAVQHLEHRLSQVTEVLKGSHDGDYGLPLPNRPAGE